MRKEYQRKANGKFLITGEYVVLRGAEALAVPLQLGQQLLMIPNEGGVIYWESFSPEGKWFETALQSLSLNILTTTDATKSLKLSEILKEIRKQNSDFLTDGGWWVRTDLDFPTHFGMGSSSTLLALLCDAAGVNPYSVLQNTFGGSGYDIACAFVDSPILYSVREDFTQPLEKKVDINDSVKNQILFVYSGNKMVSSGEVKIFSSIQTDESLIEKFSELSKLALSASDAKVFSEVMITHEKLMSELLRRPSISEYFPDFDGVIKSMGAWGGDFFMAVCNDPTAAKFYFKNKGISVIYNYQEVVLEKKRMN